MTQFNACLDQLETQAASIVNRLEQITFEELERFTEEREELVNLMQVHSTQINTASKDRIKVLLDYDTAILAKMNLFKLEASDWLNRKATIKEQRTAYNNNYTPDSMFFDHKIK
ncbi:hypothetical protein ACFQ3J_18300 [Paenibacillus provencensis]|uniref:Flagellar protein FliT n=1 Tax=Paenibacillus provencensis TaxID=441151 RepID=A0ABW3Q570_9BACL|nr:hypothetical protein [Paenibacillus sp. MER 78]MCM3128286.1 hypothetical protein [Paenibacillus sp. MER 78]